MNQLTNQELIQELQKRIKEGTMEAKVVPGEIQTESKSLFSFLGNKELLFLIGLTAVAVLVFCYATKVTYSQPTDYAIGFSDPTPTVKASLS
jgi:hypothetical protein